MNRGISIGYALLVLSVLLLGAGGFCAPVHAGTSFIRGDANVDGSLDLSDPIRVLLHLFPGGGSFPLDCADAADANDDDTLTIADAVTLLDHLFTAGAPLPAPFPGCGEDLTSTLGCISAPPCVSGPPSVPGGWIHGSANCSTNNDPAIQVQSYDADTFILRQNMCDTFEGPFLYLLFGGDTVLLLDSGAIGNAAISPVRATVQGIIDQWLIDNGQGSIELVVAHTHSHGDHVAGDGQFIGQPNTTVVGTSLSAVTNFFGITNWPTQIVTYDLGGGRVLDIVPIPGHESRSIAVYDQNTGLLLTGDSLYPGFLFIFGQSNWNTYKQSIARLVNFALPRPISYILGTHIEMSAVPGVAYPYGTNYQPNEHALELDLSHLLELNDALQLLPNPVTEVHDDFIIDGF